ncbi:MAG: hypothetical protein AAB378_01095 [Patescibacteria group bacterium]
MTTTAIALIAFALGLFVAKIIYGVQLHRRESERVSEPHAPIRTLDDLDTRR